LLNPARNVRVRNDAIATIKSDKNERESKHTSNSIFPVPDFLRAGGGCDG